MYLKRKINFLAILLLIAGLLTACGNQDNNQANTGTGGSQSSQTGNQTPGDSQSNSSIVGGQATVSKGGSTGSGSDPQRIERILPETGNKVFKYANLDFMVTGGVITNQLFASNSPTYNPDQAQLKLDLAVSNSTKDFVRVDSGLLQLKLGDGSNFSQPLDLNLQALDTRTYELAFNVPVSTKWDGAQLELNQKDKEPAFLALDGPQTTSPYPVELKAGAEVTVKDPKVSYKITRASLELDAQGERVTQGNAYLVLTVLATNHDSKYEAYVGEDNFRLSVDGTSPRTPEKTDPVAQGVKELGSQEFSLAFTIPQNAGEITLEVGEVGKDTAKISLDLNPATSSGTPVSNQNAVSPTPTIVVPK